MAFTPGSCEVDLRILIVSYRIIGGLGSLPFIGRTLVGANLSGTVSLPQVSPESVTLCIRATFLRFLLMP